MRTPCINPQEIREGDLLAYVWGEARPEVAAHVTHCDFCTAEAGALKLLETEFQSACQRLDCPETDVLLLYHMGMLPATEQQQVQIHLVACLECQAELQRFLPVLSSPSWLESLRQMGKNLLKAIQMPPATQPALAMRGAISKQVYQAGAYQVVLAKESPIAAENRWGLEGQVMRHEDQTTVLPGRVSLWQTETLIATDTVDKFGYFGLENIAPGVYILHIGLQADDIVINNVTIP